MTFDTILIIYPEGDHREVDRHLRLNELVDINGFPVSLPLESAKTIVYRVYRKSSTDTNNGPIIRYYLEQLTIDETAAISRR
ncbi:MAG: hypothetical protein JEZ04_00095 [Spirochaetales bacterium]|nr:hypothetical protein [Spirochaetales bacterium]